MIYLFTLVCLLSSSLVNSDKVHEQTSKEETPLTLETNGNSEYEIVSVNHEKTDKKESQRVVQLTAFERDIKLYLHPTDGHLAGVDTPVFKARYDPSMKPEIQFEKIDGAIESDYEFVQDPVNQAALVIKHEPDGKTSISGVIDDLAIRPLSTQSSSESDEVEISAEDDSLQSSKSISDDNVEDIDKHVIFKVSQSEKEKKIKGINAFENLELPNVNEVPEVIHPQILIVVESTMFELFDKDVKKTVDYLLSYWNAVDLRYRVFQNPTIRLNIAAIILAEDPKATPYIVNNQQTIYHAHRNDTSHIPEALKQFAKYLYTETIHDDSDQSLTMKRLGFKFDIAITMTGYDMCSFPDVCLNSPEEGCWFEPYGSLCAVIGYAYYTGACAYDAENTTAEAVAIVEDQGAYTGIISTAHELGHLFGASHSPTNEFHCPIEDGYLMSRRLTIHRESFIWSNCSIYSIHNFLRKEERARCLFNEPVTGSPAPRILPGKIFTRDQQCSRLMNSTSCEVNWHKNKCGSLFCLKHKYCKQMIEVAVLEGASCGEGRHCINGECVSEIEDTVMLELGMKESTLNTD